jgi:hypothetical protein
MKILAIFAGIALLLLLGVLLIAAAPYLPAFAVLFFAITLALFTAAGSVLIYWLWTRADRTRAEAQAIRLEAAKIHADTSAVMVSNQIVQLSPAPFGYGTTSNLHSYAPHIQQAQAIPLMEAPAPPLLDTPGPPVAPTLRDLVQRGFRPTQQHMLLGYTAHGPLYGGIEDLLSTAIAGRPKTGKTTLLRFIAAQLLLAGGSLVILDPHGSLADGANIPAEWIASSAGEMHDGAAWLIDELETRLAQYRQGRREFPPLMVMADEWPVISLASKPAVEAAQRVILEARKTNYYGLISGQGLPASQFGGSLARDALSSRYIFRTTAAQARYAGLDKETARLVEDLPRGTAIFEGMINPTPVAIPLVTGEDLALLLPRPAPPPTSSTKPDTTRPPSNVVTANYRLLTPAAPIITPPPSNPPRPAPETETEKTARLWQAGHTSVRKIAAAWPCSKDKAERLIREAREAGAL